MRIGAVLMASGSGRRFGGNKLLTMIGEKPLMTFGMDALSAIGAEKTVVVTAHEQVAMLAEKQGFKVVWNDCPEIGQGHTVSLGAKAMAGMDAALFLAADQPLITGNSLKKLIRVFEDRQGKAVCLRDETHFGNPAIFDASLFSQLMALNRDKGAKAILRALGDELMIVDCEKPDELFDVDTPEALKIVEEKLGI